MSDPVAAPAAAAAAACSSSSSAAAAPAAAPAPAPAVATAVIPSGLVTCALHQIQRGSDCVMESAPGSGVFVCLPGMECRVSAPTTAGLSAMAAMVPVDPDGESVVCALHGKSRLKNMCTQVLTEVGPQWQCTDAKRCKGYEGTPTPGATPSGVPSVAALLAAQRYNPYGSMMASPDMAAAMQANPSAYAYMAALSGAAWPTSMMGGGSGLDATGTPSAQAILASATSSDGMNATCALHSKRRTLANLVQDPAGYYRCKPGSECKSSEGSKNPYGVSDGTTAPCGIHQRNRKISLMQWNEALGCYQCRPGNECKVSGR